MSKNRNRMAERLMDIARRVEIFKKVELLEEDDWSYHDEDTWRAFPAEQQAMVFDNDVVIITAAVKRYAVGGVRDSFEYAVFKPTSWTENGQVCHDFEFIDIERTAGHAIGRAAGIVALSRCDLISLTQHAEEINREQGSGS